VLVGCRTTEFTRIDRIDRRVLGAISFYIGGTKKSILLQGVLLVGIDVLLTLVKHLFQCVVCRLHLYVLRFACGLPLNQSSLLKVLHVL